MLAEQANNNKGRHGICGYPSVYARNNVNSKILTHHRVLRRSTAGEQKLPYGRRARAAAELDPGDAART